MIVTAATRMMTGARPSPADAPFHSDHFVFLCESHFVRLAQENRLSIEIYGWGHCGPCYYGGRVVIREPTLGR